MRKLTRAQVLVWLAATASLTIASCTAFAATGVSGHLDGGFGAYAVRSLPARSTTAAMFSVGLGYPRGRVRGTFDFGATVGDDFEVARIPEGVLPGKRTLTTVLAGVEFSPSTQARGPFAGLGIGIGHTTLTGATRETEFFYDPDRQVPAQSVTDLAFGADLGWRSMGGPGPFGFQLALRFQGQMREGGIDASATTLTLGLAY